ncbi:MAG: DUF1592 domain-containing protein [Chthoniobacteraceae bacterium]
MKLLRIVTLTLFAARAASAFGAQPENAALTDAFRPLAKEYCTTCHNAEKTEGELDLEALLAKPETLWADGKLLDLLHDVVADGDMPPKKAKKKLSATEREQLRKLLDGAVNSLAQRQRDDPGLVVMPRLTRGEYRNVIRALSGGVVMKAGEYLPNEGGAGEGFANVGEAQSMSAAQFEKYIEAAKGALHCLRVSAHDGLVWSAVPREPVDEPKVAIKEATDDIIAWYIGQQQKWGALHRAELEKQFGSAHALYLEAVWRAANDRPPLAERLAPVALDKWTRILKDTETKSPFSDWAKAWRAIPANVSDAKLRATCLAIVSGKADAAAAVIAENKGDFAPPYETSFREAKEEVLAAAKNEGRWPFRVDIGDAKELFLIMTDAGDGGGGEYGLWHKGRFIFKDGTAKPWQDAVKIIGANSGRDFPWGLDGESQPNLEADSVGQKPPGALKFAVPENAIVFEVDFTLDKNRTKVASVQALVLKEKPASQSFVPGRFVFGGRDASATAKSDPNKERNNLLRKRNVSEANETKLGLNAESNLFADWTRTSIEALGGPWPGQTPDKAEPNAPYFYTVAEVRRNATPEDLAQLRLLEERLVALAQPPAAGALEAKACGLLDAFAEKAWRRQLNGDDQSKLMRLYRDAAAQGVSFDSAMKVPLLAVLASRDFLFRGREADTFVPRAQDLVAGKKTLPQSSPALASRLSFFLWASIPDDELLRLAAADKLRDPAVLVAQAMRMLKDPRAASLATDFAAQLWGFGDFESFTGPDEKRFAEFTPALRQAMFDEVMTFLADLIRNDRPLTALLDADYTFANAELAKHYGVKTEAAGFERVVMPSERGGLPTMALFLTKTSLPLRTSPVQRGVWVVEQFLGRKIPSPPPNVPKISEDEKSADGLPIRDQLAKHRADANCAACHARFDAMGVSLENFDPIGRWRAADRSGDAIVSTDTLHDGTELNGITGLKKYLRDHQDEIFRHFTRKLLGYALGRAVLPGDRALLDRMSTSFAQDGYKFSTLVEAIVTSPQFTKRRAP